MGFTEVIYTLTGYKWSCGALLIIGTLGLRSTVVLNLCLFKVNL